MSDFYHPEHLGKSKFVFWYGQVLGDWECNENPKVHLRDDVPGWAKRYKVAIFDQDPHVISEGLTNTELAMAEVLLPVTAGAGLAGANMTPQIAQNSYVMGFFKDGINLREPVILGVIPNIPQTRLGPYNKNERRTRYNPASGYNPTHLVSDSRTLVEGPPNENSSDPNVHFLARPNQLIDGMKMDYIPKPYDCDAPNNELKGIQKFIQQGINDIRNGANSSSIINTVSSFVSQLLKEMTQKVRNVALNKFMEITQKAANNLPPNLKPNLRITVENETNAINCIFNNSINGLFDLVKSILDRLLNGAIRAAECAIQNLVGKVFTNVLNKVINVIDKSLGAISKFFGGFNEKIGNIMSALDFVFGIIPFFTCEVKLKCPDVDEWSLWYGPQNKSIKAGVNFSAIQSSNSSTSSSCNTGPILSKPPKVDVVGNRGKSFKSNPIIGKDKQILAIDIIDPGTDYTPNPIISIFDEGGSGNGALVKPIVNNGSIEKIIILDGGVGYIPAPNGSTGAGGLKFSKPKDTIYFDAKEEKYEALPPKTQIVVKKNDTIALPPGTTIEIINSQGNIVDTITGLGQDTPIIINDNGSLTTPEPVESIESDTIDVTLSIDDIFITNPGKNYNDTDKIVITPDNGAILEPVFDNGKLIKVNVIDGGIGFTVQPTIYIESDTGFNARMVPIFNVIRDVVQDVETLTVIDCYSRV